jgi:iron(III)-salmochelin esterase
MSLESLDRRSALAQLSALTLAACGARPASTASSSRALRISNAAASSASTSASAAPAIEAAAPPKRAEPPELEVLDWMFPTEFGGEKRAVILKPKLIPAGTKLPVLIALHGFGETIDVKTGAYGWLKSYALDRSYRALASAPMDEADFEKLVSPERLASLNGELAKRPFGGLIVACPYMPKEIGSEMVPMEMYASWIGKRLLPRIHASLPALTGAASTGIDGVSLGGWAALRIGLLRSDLFGAVGTLQAAIIDNAQIDWAMALVAASLRGRPLRVVTSTEDVYRDTLTKFDARLSAKSIAHDFVLTQGPHDYVWNKGPGGIEMLYWHDRTLTR